MFFLLFLLFLLNGFFVAVEFAVVALHASPVHRFKKGESALDRLIQNFIENLDFFLSSSQLGVTIVSFIIGWQAEPYVAHYLESAFSLFLPMDTTFRTGISFAFALLIITFVHVVVAEQVPKSLAVRRAEYTMLICAYPFALFSYLFRPLILLIEKTSFLFVRFFPGGKVSSRISQEALEFLLLQGTLTGSLTPEERKIMMNAMKLRDLEAKEVMVPRPDVITIPSHATVKEAIDLVSRYGHTRIPVVEPDLDHCVGILHAKDLLNKPDGMKVKELARKPPIFIPETISMERLLLLFQTRKMHMALAVDEFGSVRGIVTLENVLEKLVGDIQDEYDTGEPPGIVVTPEGKLVVGGMTRIVDLESRLGISLETDQETVSGWFISEYDGFPKEGDSLVRSGFRFRVLSMDPFRRIQKMEVEKVEMKNPSDHEKGE